MAHDLILKPNSLNLTQVGQGGQRPGMATYDQDARRQLSAFASRLNNFNKTLSAYYQKNASVPAVKSLATVFVKFRDDSFNYIRAYTPALAPRFLRETLPKDAELLGFYKRFLLITKLSPQSTTQTSSTQPPTSQAPSPTPFGTPMPPALSPEAGTPRLRTPRSKVRSSAPSPSPEGAMPRAQAPVEVSEGVNKGLLVAGGLAALGGVFLLVKKAPSGRVSANRAMAREYGG